MKKIILVIVVVFLVFSSCSTPRFYKEVKSTYKSKKSFVKLYGDELVSESRFDVHKLILNHLEEELKKSSHIIYYCSPSNNWNGKEFSGVVFDVNNDEYFYFENTEKKPRKFLVTNTFEYPNDNYFKFVVENYKKGKIRYLKKLGESNISGVRTTETIYDINLISGEIHKVTFKNFLFMNGKPVTNGNVPNRVM